MPSIPPCPHPVSTFRIEVSVFLVPRFLLRHRRR
jgi:hypothetical protein